MKKISVLMFVFLFSLSSIIFAQDGNNQYIYVEDADPESVTVVEEEYYVDTYSASINQSASKPFTSRDYAHWSITVDAGLNAFLGDMLPDYSVIYKKPLKHWGIGATLEYTVNPGFSFGMAYMYNMTGAEDNRGSFESKLHHVYPFIGVNFLNYPLFNRNKKWDLWFTLGLGGVHYNSELRYAYSNSSAFAYGKTEDEWFKDENAGLGKRNKWGGVVPVGVELDYNITDQIAIGLKYQHFAYTQDDIEGGIRLNVPGDVYARKNYTYAGVSNDQMSNFALTFRWNMTGNDKTHMRHLTWDEYDENAGKLRTAEDPRYDPLADRIDSLANVVANLNYKIQEGNKATAVVDCPCPEEVYSIYFDFDKHNLDKDALITVREVAEKMKKDTSLKVKIVGYTDVDGSDKYNDSLSWHRANRAKDELVKIWGISADRITTSGEGKLSSPNRDYHPISRRCDFIFNAK